MLQAYLPTEYPRLRALKEWLEHAEDDDTVLFEGLFHLIFTVILF